MNSKVIITLLLLLTACAAPVHECNTVLTRIINTQTGECLWHGTSCPPEGFMHYDSAVHTCNCAVSEWCPTQEGPPMENFSLPNVTQSDLDSDDECQEIPTRAINPDTHICFIDKDTCLPYGYVPWQEGNECNCAVSEWCPPDQIAEDDPVHFCGKSTYGKCESDSECQMRGCNAEVCGSVHDAPVEGSSTCVVLECQDHEFYGLECLCLNKNCQWLQTS